MKPALKNKILAGLYRYFMSSQTTLTLFYKIAKTVFLKYTVNSWVILGVFYSFMTVILHGKPSQEMGKVIKNFKNHEYFIKL